MAYELNAVLGRLELLETLATENSLRVVALRQGFALIPLTRENIEILIRGNGSDMPTDWQERQRRLDEVFKDWSARGPIVHASSEMHAGVGDQAARIWRDGALVFTQKGWPYGGPISMALQRLGVTGGYIGWDEFDVVGLGQHRRTEKWL